jgi:hypothetical protein
MRSSQLCSGLVLAAASLAVLGCGETTIDGGKATKFIGKTVTDQAGVRVKSVTCPENLKAKKGATFTCTVLAKDGTKGTVLATQQDDKGNVRIAAPFLHTREAEAAIATQISKQVKATVTVTCPEIVVPKKGGTFKCEGTDGSKTRPIAVTMTDANGAFTFKVQ